MRLLLGLLVISSIAGCTLLSTRQAATSDDQTLVSELESALLESIIDDAITALAGEDHSSYPAILAPFVELADKGVDASRLTEWHRGQLALLRSAADPANPQSTITTSELRLSLLEFLDGLPGDETPGSWRAHCETPGTITDRLIQESLNDISKLVFDFEPQLDSMTSRAPRADLEIRHDEGSKESYASFEAGVSSSAFLINLANAPSCEIPALTYMNTIPGKLVIPQSAFSITVEQVPFIDGWALYILSHLKDRGVFADEAGRAGRYRIEAHILAAALVNVAISDGSWRLSDAHTFLESRLAMTEDNAAVFIERALKDRGPVSAAEGLIGFRRLRAQAMQVLGDQFSERDFHDRLLELGPVPMPFIEQHIGAWLADRSSGRIDEFMPPGE
jgi:hypothetical protein